MSLPSLCLLYILGGRGGQLSHLPKNRKYKWKDFALSPLSAPASLSPPPPPFSLNTLCLPGAGNSGTKPACSLLCSLKWGGYSSIPQEASSWPWKGLLLGCSSKIITPLEDNSVIQQVVTRYLLGARCLCPWPQRP